MACWFNTLSNAFCSVPSRFLNGLTSMSRRASARTMCYCVRQQEGARGRASRPKSASPALRCRTTLPMRSSEVPRRQSLRIWWAVRASSWHPPGTSPDCACLALSSDLHGARRCMLMLGHRTERALSFHLSIPLPRRCSLRASGTSIDVNREDVDVVRCSAQWIEAEHCFSRWS